jgi:hypothetical protein
LSWNANETVDGLKNVAYHLSEAIQEKMRRGLNGFAARGRDIGVIDFDGQEMRDNEVWKMVRYFNEALWRSGEFIMM